MAPAMLKPAVFAAITCGIITIVTLFAIVGVRITAALSADIGRGFRSAGARKACHNFAGG